MRTTGFGVVVLAGVLAGAIGFAAPASADPGGHGRGGDRTNRYDAQGCQQGGHEARVEAETGRSFTNSGDCTSHTAQGGSLTAASGQITLTGSAPYACSAPEGQCWGTLSVSGAPGNATVEVLAEVGGVVSLPVKTDLNGSYQGNAYVSCASTGPQEQFQAVVLDTPLKSAWITGSC